MSKMGRPTTYTSELADWVCKMIATHACGLRKLERMFDDFPHPSTIYAWLYDHPEFSEQYFTARKAQAAVLADSMLDLDEEIKTYEDKDGNERIDAGILGRAKLAYEIRKWHAAKMAPRMFGERANQEESNPQETLQKIQSLVADLNKTNQSDI
jgi:hypothetical protein